MGGKGSGGGFKGNPERAREAGKKGGASTFKQYGPEYYQEIGAIGGGRLVAERGVGHMAEIGRKGGQNKGRNSRERIAREAGLRTGE